MSAERRTLSDIDFSVIIGGWVREAMGWIFLIRRRRKKTEVVVMGSGGSCRKVKERGCGFQNDHHLEEC